MHARRYALTGFLFGLALPVLGSIVEAATRYRALPFGAALVAAQGEALLWIIDSAPLVVALVAWMVGRRQDELVEAQVAAQEQFLRTAAELGGASQGLLAAVGSFSAQATQTAASVRETTATMGQLAHTATQAALTAETVIGASLAAQKTADEGAAAAEIFLTEMARLAEEVRGLSRSIEGLNTRMRDIFEVASVVNYIADRSQRLAESAAGEVQAAGASSPGLTGVVDEMRAHAEDSKRAAAQVKGILGEVHKSMLAAMTAAEIGVRRAEQGAQVAAGSGETIERLAAAIRDSSAAAREIATVAQQQDQGIDQVQRAMNEIYLAAQETMTATHAVAGQARGLDDLAQGLKRLVEEQVA